MQWIKYLDLSSDLGFMSYPGKGNWTIDGVEISSSFDSGNLKSIELNGMLSKNQKKRN